MLQQIVFSVCTLLAPTQCKDVYLQIASEFGASLQLPFNCARQGQIEGQKWIQQHPGWRIERWKCPAAGMIDVNL
jgi:hypothetical protein